jgi:hypothetical protein
MLPAFLKWPSWSRGGAAAPGRQTRSRRLALEVLEDRTLLSVGPDVNDQLAEARTGASALGVATRILEVDRFGIESPTDVDLFSFTAAADQTIEFDIDNRNGSDLDSYLRLFNAAGKQMAANDNGPHPGEVASRGAYLKFTFQVDGTYFLGVSGAPNTRYDPRTGAGDVAGDTGDYLLTVLPSDIKDPNDQIGDGFLNTPAGNLGRITGPRRVNNQAIGFATDVDLFRFTAGAGQTLSFDIDRPARILDSYLRVFDSRGVELAANDDGSAPGEPFNLASYLEVTFPRAGIYYVGVSGYPNTGYSIRTGDGDVPGGQGRYALTVAPVVDTDTNDQVGERVRDLGTLARPVTVSSFALERPRDVDLFRFTARAGKTVRFDLDRRAGSGLDSILRLFDGRGRPLALNDDAAAPGEQASQESFLEYTFTANGTYFIGVSGFGDDNYSAMTGTGDAPGSSGAFSLTALMVAEFNDPNDQTAETRDADARRPGFGLTAKRSGLMVRRDSLSRGTDVFLTSFTVRRGETRSFDIDRVTNGLNTYLRLFDSNGRPLPGGVNDDGRAPGEPFSSDSYLRYRFDRAGRYFVGVSSFPNTAYNARSGDGDRPGGGAGGFTLSVAEEPATGPGLGGLIAGFVFRDSKIEVGEFTATERGFPRRAVQLFDARGETEIRRTTSDADGRFSFLDVPAGSYLVIVPVIPDTGFSLTTPPATRRVTVSTGRVPLQLFGLKADST